MHQHASTNAKTNSSNSAYEPSDSMHAKKSPYASKSALISMPDSPPLPVDEPSDYRSMHANKVPFSVLSATKTGRPQTASSSRGLSDLSPMHASPMRTFANSSPYDPASPSNVTPPSYFSMPLQVPTPFHSFPVSPYPMYPSSSNAPPSIVQSKLSLLVTTSLIILKFLLQQTSPHLFFRASQTMAVENAFSMKPNFKI